MGPHHGDRSQQGRDGVADCHGETLDAVTNHPMLKGVTIPRTGRIGPIGTLTTKTLIISGERGFTTPPSGQRFAKLYAYDKATDASWRT
jgi:quinoprotein glucose dehydrogenase